MATAIGDLAVFITADTADFAKGVAGAMQSAQSFASGVTGVLSKVGEFAKSAFDMVVAGVSEAMNKIDDMAHSADMIGLSIDEFQALSLAATLANTPIETVQKSMLKLNRLMSDVRNDVGKQGIFRELGLDFQQLAAMTPYERFAKIQDAIAGLASADDRARAATQLFGKAGAEMLHLLTDGSAGLRAAESDIAAFGLSMSRVDAAGVEAANDAWDRFVTLAGAAYQKLAVELAPTIQAVIEWMIDGVSGAGDFGSAIEAAADAATNAIARLLDILDELQKYRRAIQLASFISNPAGHMLANAGMSALEGESRFLDRVKAIKEANAARKPGAAGLADDDFEEQAKAAKKHADDLKREHEKLVADAKRLADSVRTPAEIMADKFREAHDFLSAGLITMDTYGRLVGKTREDFEKAELAALGIDKASSKGVGAAVQGTTAGFSAVQEANRAMAAERELDKKHLAVAERAAKTLERIEAEVAKPKPKEGVVRL